MNEWERPVLRLHQRWTQFESALAQIEGALLAGLLLIMILFAFVQVILRNFFQTGIFGVDLLLRQGLLWLGLLGASLAVRGAGRHIEIDILSRALPPEWAGGIRRVTDTFAAIICALLVRASYLFVAEEWAAGSLIAGFFPAWTFQAILPIGFTLMCIRFLAAALLGRPKAPPPGLESNMEETP
jgi:TRAP-type C4-dicarboxylate transport system permease small subunit